MTKKDLKYGYVVKLANGDLCLLHPKFNYVFNREVDEKDTFLRNLKDGRYENNLYFYNDNLTIEVCGNEEYTIIEVYEDYTLTNLLWTRKVTPKLTADERVILLKLPIKYEYIARDESDDIYIFEDKPYKNNINKMWLGNKYKNFPYKHLFNFIKWEDDKPYKITDLLKEGVIN